MTTATMKSKGRITIPARVRESLRVVAGDRSLFVQSEPGQYLLIAANQPVTELKGMFGKARRVISIDEINAAIVTHEPTSR